MPVRDKFAQIRFAVAPSVANKVPFIANKVPSRSRAVAQTGSLWCVTLPNSIFGEVTHHHEPV